jgi:hypothetical protein
MTTPSPELPAPGSPEELARFALIQEKLAPLYRRVFPDRLAPRAVVVVPSLSLDAEVMANITGVRHYEERMLCMLMLLRLPRAHVIFVTSEPVDPTIIDYYLHLLPGIPTAHARRRLTLFSCHDASRTPLTRKILDRPRLLARIRESIPYPELSHITCFAASPLERTLAVRLGAPIYACDPALSYLGSKSGSRRLFRDAGLLFPDGIEDLKNGNDVAEALSELKRRNPRLRRAVVKLNDGFSGEGNAVFEYRGFEGRVGRSEVVRSLKFEADREKWEGFEPKLRQMGGIVEAFIEGEGTGNGSSPSVQCRINPLREVEVISTHEQVLGGPSHQIFTGCAFPAREEYRLELQQMGLTVAALLRDRGALGRFGVDFISIRESDRFKHYAIEINLRKGGTTHPFMMLQYLTDGRFEAETGLYKSPSGQPRYYFASDNLQSESYRGLTPRDLIDIAVDHNLHFHGASQRGVVFHLIGALSEFGKLGMVCVAGTRADARKLYDDTVDVLNRETEKNAP